MPHGVRGYSPLLYVRDTDGATEASSTQLRNGEKKSSTLLRDRREIFYHLAISGQIVNCVLWHINNTCLGGGVERFTVRGQHVAKLLGRRGTVLTGYFDTVEFGQSFTVTYTLSGYITSVTSVTIRTDSPRGTVVHVAYRSAHARLQRHRLK